MLARIRAFSTQRRLLLLLICLIAAFVLGVVAISARSPRSSVNLALAPGVDMAVTTVTRSPLAATYAQGTQFSIVITVANLGAGVGDLNTVLVTNELASRGVNYINFVSSTPGGIFTCSPVGSSAVCTNSTSIFPIGGVETITFNVNANIPGGPYFNAASVSVTTGEDLVPGNNTAADPSSYTITPSTPTFTSTATLSPTPTTTTTPTASLTPLPSFTAVPTITPTFTATFIPPPPTRTPLPRPAQAGQAIPIPPSGVNIIVLVDGANIRIRPALGADLVGIVNAGMVFENVIARSGDGQWLEIDYFGDLAWIGVPIISVLQGDINALPVADPLTIPYGGWEQPRAGLTSVTSPNTVRLAYSGMRLRSGPGPGFIVLANPLRYTVMPILGRTAQNSWLQVNFEGVLGWISYEPDVMEFSSAEAFYNAPVDGVIADAVPYSDNTFDTLVDNLSYMLGRLDIAQQSLNEIRDIWTTIGLGGTVQCGVYPAQPTNFNIPVPILTAFYNDLNPLVTQFNEAMENIRRAIQLFIEACSSPQPADGVIGAGAVSAALQYVNAADALMPGIRAQIIALLPTQAPIGPNQCQFIYQNRSQVIPRLLNVTPVLVHMDDNERVLGFCFDGTAGQTFRLEALRVRGNLAPQISVSPFTDPTAFIAVGNVPEGDALLAGQPTPVGGTQSGYVSLNIQIPTTGQYLVIVSVFNQPRPDGELALMLTDLLAIPNAASPGIALDLNGNVIVNSPGSVAAGTTIPGFATPIFTGPTPIGATPTPRPTQPT